MLFVLSEHRVTVGPSQKAIYYEKEDLHLLTEKMRQENGWSSKQLCL